MHRRALLFSGALGPLFVACSLVIDTTGLSGGGGGDGDGQGDAALDAPTDAAADGGSEAGDVISGDGGAAPALRQQTPAIVGNSGPMTLSFEKPPLVGSVITVLVASRDSSGGEPPLPMVAGQGVAWQPLVDTKATAHVRALVFLATVRTPEATLTLQFTSTAPRVSATAEEWSNLSNRVDATNSATGVGVSIAPGQATTSGPNAILIAVGVHNLSESAVSSPGGAWSSLRSTSGVVPQILPVFQLAARPATLNPAWTWPSSSDNAAVIVAIASN